MPVGFTVKNKYSYNFHVDWYFSSGRDMSGDDFTGNEKNACLLPGAQIPCAIAVLTRLFPPSSSAQNSKVNFGVEYTVTHDEYFGIGVSDFHIWNYSGEQIPVNLSFESRGKTKHIDQIIADNGFGADFYHQSYGHFDGDFPLIIKMEYEKMVNLGNASHPGPSYIYPDLIWHSVQSVRSLMDFAVKHNYYP